MTRGQGTRLTDQQRLQIVSELSTTGRRSNRAIARAHGVDESAIRQLWKHRDKIMERTCGVAADVLARRLRYTPPAFPQIERALLEWIERLRRHKLPVPPT